MKKLPGGDNQQRNPRGNDFGWQSLHEKRCEVMSRCWLWPNEMDFFEPIYSADYRIAYVNGFEWTWAKTFRVWVRVDPQTSIGG